jgi:hypothetical protein
MRGSAYAPIDKWDPASVCGALGADTAMMLLVMPTMD